VPVIVKAGQQFQFLSAELWRYISAAVRRKPNDCYVAVAYFGDHASRLLPLRAGSTLVVDITQFCRPALSCPLYFIDKCKNIADTFVGFCHGNVIGVAL
jgi:hypothetical protein